jgi:hypothetical protein
MVGKGFSASKHHPVKFNGRFDLAKEQTFEDFMSSVRLIEKKFKNMPTISTFFKPLALSQLDYFVFNFLTTVMTQS